VGVRRAAHGSGDIPHRAVTTGDIDDPAAGWCSLSCTTESSPDAAGEIIVLRVVGEGDLSTVSILRAALGEGLQAHPAAVLVDLTRMVFGSAPGLDLLTQSGHTAAGHPTSFAVRGVSSQLDRVWSLGGERWGG
jgi:anti-anti-sigma regulatory factor